MIIKSGIDLIEVKRIKRAVDRWNGKFIKKVFTDKEVDYSKDKRFFYQHLAARFATKEAVLKAFGEGRRRFTPLEKITDKPSGKNKAVGDRKKDSLMGFIKWRDIEVLNQKNGKPEIKIYGYLEDLKEKEKIKNISVSISHTKNYAVASCILIKEGF